MRLKRKIAMQVDTKVFFIEIQCGETVVEKLTWLKYSKRMGSQVSVRKFLKMSKEEVNKLTMSSEIAY